MTIWDELTPEQLWVMVSAYEEGFLYGVMDDHAAAVRRQQGLALSDLDDDAKRRLIPHFAEVVTDMIARDWIEIRETWRWDAVPPMTPEEIQEALHDELTWLSGPDLDSRTIMLMTTDHWDRLADRFGTAK